MSKTLKLIGLILVAGVNTFILFMSSLLAAGGDGSADGIYKVLIGGGVFIAIFFLIGLKRWFDNRPGMGIVALALPTAYATMIVILIVTGLLGIKLG